MKKINLKKLSSKQRILGLLISGVILIGLSAVLANMLIKADDDVYDPNVVSNYQAEEETAAKSTEDDEQTEPTPEPKPQTNWPVTYSMEQANSVTVVVNKKHRLPSNYEPQLISVAGGQMRPEAATPLQNLMNDAQTAGNPMVIVSSYRSYNTQVSTYQYWVDTQGQTQADRESARPGHSEHQTGLTADMGNPDGSCRLLACFGSGAAGTWLTNNAHSYGFIIRYPDGKESETGYIYEPWHIRYLGVDVATAVYNSGLTLDQYYGVEAGGY